MTQTFYIHSPYIILPKCFIAIVTWSFKSCFNHHVISNNNKCKSVSLSFFFFFFCHSIPVSYILVMRSPLLSNLTKSENQSQILKLGIISLESLLVTNVDLVRFSLETEVTPGYKMKWHLLQGVRNLYNILKPEGANISKGIYQKIWVC